MPRFEEDGRPFLPRPGWESEQRHRDLLDALDEVVFTTDAQGRWTYLNRAWQQLTGENPRDCLGRDFAEWVHPGERDRVIALAMAVMRGEADYCAHLVRMRHRDGQYRWAHVRSRAFRDDNGTLFANAGTLLDVTGEQGARADAERLRRDLAKALHRVAAVAEAQRRAVAVELHADVVQLITAATWNLEAAADDDARTDALVQARADLAEAEAACRDLMTRLLPAELADSSDLVTAIAEHASSVAASSGLRVTVHTDLDGQRYPDEVQVAVFRVVQEALRNVVKHAQAASAQVELRGDAAGVRGQVRDDGVGISSAVLTAPPNGHIGLLSMRELTAAAGGTVDVRRASGGGTVVAFDVATVDPRTFP